MADSTASKKSRRSGRESKGRGNRSKAAEKPAVVETPQSAPKAPAAAVAVAEPAEPVSASLATVIDHTQTLAQVMADTTEDLLSMENPPAWSVYATDVLTDCLSHLTRVDSRFMVQGDSKSSGPNVIRVKIDIMFDLARVIYGNAKLIARSEPDAAKYEEALRDIIADFANMLKADEYKAE